jgi:uncharacterized protein YndB with AHSA1/START domain
MTHSHPDADRSLVFDRLFDASREMVWQAWTTPQHIAQWWGPTGFTNSVSEMNVKPGGVWRFVMHGPDGTDYPNKITFIEVVPLKKLVYAHGGDDDKPADFHVTVTFASENGKTRLTMAMLFQTAAARDYVIREHGAEKGANQTLDRLEAHLSTMRDSQTGAA